MYGNTAISDSTAAIWCQNGTILLTNNIVISTRDGIMRFSNFSSDVINGDYDLGPHSFTYGSGPHDVISGSAISTWFVSTNTGLYWLSSGSPARNIALAGVFSPVNFFGNIQTSVSDVGFIQYSSTLTGDSRVLDPSPSTGADYWANVNVPPIPPTITQQPSNASGLTGNPQTFTVAATGTQPLAYQWFFNSSGIGGATATSYTIAAPTPANNGQYYCQVTNIAGSINSFAATLVITNAPPLNNPSNLVIIIQ